MSAASAFRSRFNIVRHIVPASTPSLNLACNVYRRMPTSPSAKGAATPPIIFTHANGFHKELWEPVVGRLSPRWTGNDMYAFDCRNQGDSAVINKDVLENTFDWYSYAADILKIVDTFDLKKPIGVGHSFGASAFVLAELMRPGTFSTIVAVDPTMFPKATYISAGLDDNPMAQITLKRRDTWKDRADARAKLLEKRFFQSWHPEALDLYLEHGMLDVTDKDGSASITLKCPKFQEAITFASVGTGIHDAFERLNELRIPVHIIAGRTSDFNPPELSNMKLNQCKYGSLDTIEGTGHMLNFEKPEETGEASRIHFQRGETVY
ncbi:Alpha/beta hydrolase fold-1 [Dissophora ornata]|nr:Alpha/beta hydrolase fold-1 [Dissophora ornata]